mmetsp:Transcript_15622/g.31273  ORF Transcript_15622/g.31273 Transcript_15622/m.31273 type:complete len:464 (+) Transcript_15622:102-1493(+)|eukprot:CAMPEP_0171625840 /NCGR_PEP_ID=MMETSP0990-20121206/19649_1 /TAXON_ID=483369 /ORGANISM="non described non described, Strain CCMP2098" /LENGTH=463 /DNA_ID=CAMNT_0012193047 /DNA_START=47 /DNA_END=1438 /DNA_ORIENTATION=-
MASKRQLLFGFSAAAICIAIVFSRKKKREERKKTSISALEDWVRCWVESKQLPCAQLLLVHRDEEILHVCSGTGADGEALRRDAIFRIYSMTKPVTASLALILAEKGVLSLDDEVAKHLPCFAAQRVLVGGDGGGAGSGEGSPKTEALKRPLTIRHLLTHTSGITYGIFGASVADELFCAQFPPELKSDWFSKVPLQTLVEAVAKTPLLFQPGEAWHYGWSLDVLGRVLQVAWASAEGNGQELSLGQLMQQELFGPLGMTDTGFQVPPSDAHRLVPCAVGTPGFQFQSPSPPGHFAADRVAPCGNFESGGGGLVSTADDFMKFAQFLRTGKASSPAGASAGQRLLSEGSVALLKTNALPNNADVCTVSFEKGAFAEGVGPGVGFSAGAMSVLTQPEKAPGGALSGEGEFGWGGVASTWFFVDPLHDLTAVFMTQLVPSSSLPLRPQLRWLAHNAIAAGTGAWC